MKAARIHAYGHSDQVQLEDIAMPSPGAGEVLVRIHAVGINPIDWKIREVLLAKAAPRALPFTLGQDFAGKVISLGEDVAGVEASDTVYGFANGAYAEYAVVSPSMIASRPRTVHYKTAAALPTPGLTALQIVRDAVQAQQGSDDPDPRRRRQRRLDRDPAVPVPGSARGRHGGEPRRSLPQRPRRGRGYRLPHRAV